MNPDTKKIAADVARPVASMKGATGEATRHSVKIRLPRFTSVSSSDSPRISYSDTFTSSNLLKRYGSGAGAVVVKVTPDGRKIIVAESAKRSISFRDKARHYFYGAATALDLSGTGLERSRSKKPVGIKLGTLSDDARQLRNDANVRLFGRQQKITDAR